MKKFLSFSLIAVFLSGCAFWSNTEVDLFYDRDITYSEESIEDFDGFEPFGFEPLPGNGFIEGGLSFPSSEIPEDLFVCADGDIGEMCQYSRVESDDYEYGVGYKIEVPAGTYRVYSKTDTGSMFNPMIGGYTEAVECGLTVDCSDNNFIPVVVVEGETISGIDVFDFEAQL